MKVPAAYTSYQLATWMAVTLGEIGEQLGWTGETLQLVEATTDVALAYGVDDVFVATDLRKLRAFAKRAAWAAVATATVGKFAFSADGQRFDRQQVHEHAVGMLTQVEADCLEFESVAHVRSVMRPHDPYVVIPDFDRTPVP